MLFNCCDSRFPFFRYLILVGLTFGLAGLSFEAIRADEASELKLKTDRVIIFKDGYGLVVKKGTAQTDENGIVYTNQVPDSAILGSFWIVPQKGTLKSTIAGWKKTEESTSRKITCTSVVEIIKANLGKHCSFWIGKDEKVEGTILKILSLDENAPATAPMGSPNYRAIVNSIRSSAAPARAGGAVEYSSVKAQHFIVRTKVGDMMVAVPSVRNLTIDDMVSTIDQTIEAKKTEKQLTLKFDKPNSKVEIHMMYFRPDLRWIPTYRVDLSNEEFKVQSKKPEGKDATTKRPRFKTAKLHLQAELLNEAEDFIDVPIHVVVGVPNFRFRSIPSPMVLEPALRNMLQQAAPQLMGNPSQMSNAMFTQRGGERRGRVQSELETAMVTLANETKSKGGNDLHVYKLDMMSLKKGERASVPILESQVAYRDVYTWDIQLKHSSSIGFAPTSSGTESPLVLSENKVFRQIEMINDSKIPWTTGAAMFVDGYQPLAQELLTYTSPGTSCRVPVTVSVDLRGSVSDAETKRVLKAFKWHNQTYARISGRVDVSLKNNKSEPVSVEISLRVGGKAIDASDDGVIKIEGLRLDDWYSRSADRINNSSLIAWSTEIEPGETFKPNSNYEFYIR